MYRLGFSRALWTSCCVRCVDRIGSRRSPVSAGRTRKVISLTWMWSLRCPLLTALYRQRDRREECVRCSLSRRDDRPWYRARKAREFGQCETKIKQLYEQSSGTFWAAQTLRNCLEQGRSYMCTERKPVLATHSTLNAAIASTTC